MSKASRELLLIVPGVALGYLLFYLSGVFDRFPLVYYCCGGAASVGGPFPPLEPAYAIDFIFWIAVSIVLLEIWDRKGLHLVHREDDE